MIVAGIDEAGLGPVLGPMFVSATAFSIDDALADQSMWQLLSSAVSRKPAKRPTRIAIADSKKLYNRQKDDGLVHLERGVLTMLACLQPAIANLNELLQAVSPGRWPSWANIRGTISRPFPCRDRPARPASIFATMASRCAWINSA